MIYVSTVPLQENKTTIDFFPECFQLGLRKCVCISNALQLSGQQRILVERVTFRKPWRNAVNASGMRFCIDLSGVFFFFRKGAWGLGMKKTKKKTNPTCFGWVTEIQHVLWINRLILRAIPFGHINLAFWGWTLIPGDVSDVFFILRWGSGESMKTFGGAGERTL